MSCVSLSLYNGILTGEGGGVAEVASLTQTIFHIPGNTESSLDAIHHPHHWPLCIPVHSFTRQTVLRHSLPCSPQSPTRPGVTFFFFFFFAGSSPPSEVRLWVCILVLPFNCVSLVHPSGFSCLLHKNRTIKDCYENWNL